MFNRGAQPSQAVPLATFSLQLVTPLPQLALQQQLEPVLVIMGAACQHLSISVPYLELVLFWTLKWTPA